MDQFNEWRSALLVALNDKNLPVDEHLKMCSEFVNQIIDHNYLLAPNAEYTESFLKDTLIRAIWQILSIKITFSTKGKANTLINFLKTCLPLISWSYVNDRFDLFRPLSDILYANKSLYESIVSSSSYQPPKRKNGKNSYAPIQIKPQNPVKTLYNFFISHELLTVMTLRFQRNEEIPILLEHLYYFLFYFKQMREQIREETALALLFNFFNFFGKFINVNILPLKAKLIDQKQVLSIFSLVIELANFYQYEVQDSVLQLIFDYGYNQIKESNLESQLFGISMLKIFADSTDRSLNFFANSIKKTNFMIDFMSRDLHPDVIEKTIPILTKMSSLECIKLDDLKQIYTIAKNVHNTGKEKMIKLTNDLLLELPFSDASKFFKINMEETSDYLYLLSNYLVKKKEIPNELAQDFITNIINIGSIIYRKNKSEGDSLINNIIKPVFNSKYKKIVLANCFSIIMKEYNQFIMVLMQSIARDNSFTIKTDFNIDVYNKICSYLPSLSIQQRASFYPLLSLLSYPLQIKTSISLLQNAMNADDDSMWAFLCALMMKAGLSAFENDGVRYIADFIQKMEKIPESRSFTNFFKVFMLLYNIFANNIVLEKTNSRQKKIIPTKYSIRRSPLQFEDKLIEQILTFNDQEILKTSCQAFVELYSNLETKSSSYDIFIQLLEKAVNDNQLIHAIDLIYNFCSENDKKEVSRLISHSFNEKIIKDELKNPLNLKVQYNLNIKEPPCGEIVQVSINRETPVQAFLALLSPNLPEAPSKYVIKVKNVEKNNCPINISNNFQPMNYVEIHNRTVAGRSVLTLNNPSEYLRNLQFTDKLLSYFKNNDKTHSEELMNSIWKLLCYLPSDESLQELSAKPSEFLCELQKATNKYYIRYLYQILLWRLRSKKYQSLYSSELQNVLSELVSQDELSAFCADEIVCLLEIYPLPDFIIPSLKILSNKDIKESTKRIASSVISKFKFDTTNIVGNKANIDLIMKAITIMTPKVWDEFKVFLFQIKNEKSLYQMSIFALTKNLPNSQYFTEIFSLYLPNFLAEDSSRQISLCLKLLKDNPSIGLATALNKAISNNIQNKIENSESISQIVNEITSIIEICNDSDVLNKLFDAISKINSYYESARPIINQFISKINNLKLDRWSFVPEIHTAKYRGLRNLQATCYMNSDLQQLYHIPAFRYLISKEATEGEGIDENKRDFLRSLQFLMDDMSLMKTKYCDPEVFFYSWTQLHGGIFKTNEQQDAQEFLTFFFDDLPKNVLSLFEGIAITTIKEKSSNNNNNDDDEIDEDSIGFIQSREEPFCALTLPIKDFDNMNDSLDSIYQTQVLFGDNQYKLDDTKKIDAEQYQRIKVAPPVLIIQLKRFEYDLTTHLRIKINKKFEILKNISLKEYVVDETKNDSDYNYSLHGVVVHRGEGSHGHYTSLINIDSDWFRFDDMDVQKVGEKVFREEAFGTDNDYSKNNNNQYEYYETDNINGYLLFYINDDAKVDNKLLLDSSFDIFIPEEKKLEIDQQNKSYLFEQFAFLEPTFHFFNEISSPDQLRDYFFNIFSHSKQNSKELSALIIERLKELYQNQPELILGLVDWMLNNFKEKVLNFYICCSVMDIVDALSDLIMFCCSNVPVDKSGELFGNFIIELQQLIPKWIQISEICKTIIKYLKLSPENVKFAQNMGWADIIMIFIYEVFDGSRNEKSLKFINISEIFEIAKIIASTEAKQIYIDLPTINNLVSKSDKSYNAYKSLLVECTALNIFDITQISELIPTEFTKPKIMEMYLSKVEPSTFNEIVVNKLEKEMHYSRYLIMKYLIDKKKEFKYILIANPSYLIDCLLLSGNEYRDLANNTEALMVEIYEDKEISMDIKKDLLNKMIAIVPTLKARKEIQLTPFLHVLLVLLKTTNYPRNLPIKGLEDLKSESNYMLAVSAYSDSSQLMSIFKSKAQKIIFNNIPSSVSLTTTNKFVGEFAPVLESASNELFSQIINQNEWNQIIEKYKASYSGYDLITITNLLEIIIKRNSLLMLENPIPIELSNSAIKFIIKIITMNGVCEPQYSANFARHLPAFIDYVRDPEIIETLLKVVANVLNSNNLPAKQREELINTYFIYIPKFMYKHTNISKDADEDKVPDEEAKKFKEAFSHFSIQRIDNVCAFISNISKDDIIIALNLLVCISTFNETYKNDLMMFAQDKIKTISISTKGSKMINNNIMASLIFQLLLLNPNKDTITNMIDVYNQASKGYQGSRDVMFKVLNVLQAEKSKGWSGVFASLIFEKARYDKEEERLFFKIALPKIKTEKEIVDLLKRCSQNFNLIGQIQSSSKEDAANQLEKIALLIEVFSNRMKKEDIIAYFHIDKNWAGQSGRFQKAIEAIFGKEEMTK